MTKAITTSRPLHNTFRGTSAQHQVLWIPKYGTRKRGRRSRTFLVVCLVFVFPMLVHCTSYIENLISDCECDTVDELRKMMMDREEQKIFTMYDVRRTSYVLTHKRTMGGTCMICIIFACIIYIHIHACMRMYIIHTYAYIRCIVRAPHVVRVCMCSRVCVCMYVCVRACVRRTLCDAVCVRT